MRLLAVSSLTVAKKHLSSFPERSLGRQATHWVAGAFTVLENFDFMMFLCICSGSDEDDKFLLGIHNAIRQNHSSIQTRVHMHSHRDMDTDMEDRLGALWQGSPPWVFGAIFLAALGIGNKKTGDKMVKQQCPVALGKAVKWGIMRMNLLCLLCPREIMRHHTELGTSLEMTK